MTERGPIGDASGHCPSLRHPKETQTDNKESSIGTPIPPNHALIDRYCAVCLFFFIMKYDHSLSQYVAAHTPHLTARGALWRGLSSHNHEPIHHRSYKVTLSPQREGSLWKKANFKSNKLVHL